jgi:hypothetical protein
MSLQAMVWALKQAPVTDASAHLILIGLADHAHDDGTGSYPFRETLAAYARCSLRTVASKLRLLEDMGVIRRGDQQLVAHYRPDRRPVVYDLNYGVQDLHVVTEDDGCGPDDMQYAAPRQGNDVQNQVERGAESGTNDVQLSAHRTVLNHSKEPLNSPADQKSASQDDDGFDEFWNAYPKSERLVVTRAAYEAALKKADRHVILQGAFGYARKVRQENTEARFVATSANWLREERWNDSYPEPVTPKRPWCAVAD